VIEERKIENDEESESEMEIESSNNPA